ncbi:MAG: O-antigen ligase family protein [Candidatus Electrothrix scaldis]|nr:MAG: O-antigen ligase family protein [Candidatus Electrothrix sp. GW3-3]
MIQHRKFKIVIFSSLFTIVLFVPFLFSLLKRFYFYQAIIVGIILLPILLIPLVRSPRKTLLALLLLSIPLNPSVALLQDYSFIFPLAIKFWFSDLLLFFCWCYIFLNNLIGRTNYSRIISKSSRIVLNFFLIWLAFALFSMIFAVDRLIVLIELIKIIRILLIFLTIPYLINSEKDLAFIAACLIGAVFLQALLILAQYSTGEQLLRLPGGARNLDITSDGLLFRPSGTLGHSSNFAKISALVLPVCLTLQQHDSRPFMKIFFTLALLIIIISSVVVVSRIGLATSALGITLTFLLSLRTAKGRKKILLQLYLCVIVFFVAWITGGERIIVRMTYDNFSSGSRLPMWLTALEVIKSHPLGVGLNNYLHIASQYDFYGIVESYPFPVHNVFLLNFAELGVVGGGCFIGLLVSVVVLARNIAKRVHDDMDAAILQSLGIGIACSWLQGLVGWGHRSSFIHLPFFAILAGTIVAYNYLIAQKYNRAYWTEPF